VADLDKYLVPYLVSQGVSFVLLLAATQSTKVARAMFALMFLAASATNMYSGATQPEVYLEYGKLALPFYRDFINGWFSHNNHILVPLIAMGQLAIGIGMLLRGSPVRWACYGAIIFLISIAPLMIGSAFPFSVTVSVAAFLILTRDDYRYLWRKRSEVKARTT
jgi:hypothetical protein